MDNTGENMAEEEGIYFKGKKVYCIEKNEIYPSINFVATRITQNIKEALKDPEKAIYGKHYRFATPEDLAMGREVSKADYPKKNKSKTKVVEEIPVKVSETPVVKKRMTNEELDNLKKAREIADSMTDYLNQLEGIFTKPMSEQEKIDSFNMAALYVGKLMVSFCDFCATQEIYVERGVRGGKIISKKKEAENKEENYEFVEV